MPYALARARTLADCKNSLFTVMQHLLVYTDTTHIIPGDMSLAGVSCLSGCGYADFYDGLLIHSELR